jgi:myo-inositol-1(or 4)-monophosphatase
MSEHLQFAKEFAHTAGKIIRENFTLNMSKEWKGDNTPVTETDLNINSLLIEEIGKRFPTHSVRGEEESLVKENADYVWVCDPVDGTIPFSHGIPICTFSLALVYKGKSIVGVTYDPFGDRLFSAEKDKGARLNDKPIKVSHSDFLKGTLASYEHFETEKYHIGKLVDYLEMKEGVKTMKLNSFVYPSSLVATGELSFTLFPHITAHDAAAIKVIVEEAGGKVTDLFGNEQRYDQEIKGLIVSNGLIHDKLIQLSRELVVDPDQSA